MQTGIQKSEQNIASIIKSMLSFNLATAQGIEPRAGGLEAPMLPLHQTAASKSWRRERDLNPRGISPSLFSRQLR